MGSWRFWNGMGWDGMRFFWNGMGWDENFFEMGWDGMGWDFFEMGWHGMKNRLGWDGMKNSKNSSFTECAAGENFLETSPPDYRFLFKKFESGTYNYLPPPTWITMKGFFSAAGKNFQGLPLPLLNDFPLIYTYFMNMCFLMRSCSWDFTRNGMGWDEIFLKWDGMGWKNALGWDVMGRRSFWNGMGWDDKILKWDGMGWKKFWNGMGWDGFLKTWDGMGWDKKVNGMGWVWDAIWDIPLIFHLGYPI